MCVTADLVFTLREKPHPRFTRRDNDLVFRANISLLAALTGVTVQVLTLDGRTLPIAVNTIVQPGYTQTVAGEGMPNPRDPSGKRGDLVIEFDISFPKALSIPQKQLLQKALTK